VGRRTLREEMVESAKEATELADDTVEFPDRVPVVAKDTTELVTSPSDPM
jgi:hypothetical protein